MPKINSLENTKKAKNRRVRVNKNSLFSKQEIGATISINLKLKKNLYKKLK